VDLDGVAAAESDVGTAMRKDEWNWRWAQTGPVGVGSAGVDLAAGQIAIGFVAPEIEG